MEEIIDPAIHNQILAALQDDILEISSIQTHVLKGCRVDFRYIFKTQTHLDIYPDLTAFDIAANAVLLQQREGPAIKGIIVVQASVYLEKETDKLSKLDITRVELKE